jgi:hypothetical protein
MIIGKLSVLSWSVFKIAANAEHIRRQGFEIPKLVYFRKFNQRTKAESLHFCPAFVYALLAVVRFI